MLAGIENGLGLDIVVWLQAHGNPLLDMIAQFIHLFGAPGTYLLLLLPLLLGWQIAGLSPRPIPVYGEGEQGIVQPIERWARVYQWVFTVITTILLADVFKLLFHAPRPYQVAPELVRLLVVQRSNYGLPSGHVAIALAMTGLVAVWSGRRWAWILVAGFTLLVAWARMYAGVHYPQDVIAGAVVGLLSLVFSLRYFERSMSVWRHMHPVLRIALVAVALFLVINVPGI